MSLREEDKQKSGCPSRGLGLAAAALGVGVGAALYYFFSKRPENPDTEGATSAQWQCESTQDTPTLREDIISSDDYTTISENTTTDTSIMEDSSYTRSHSSHNLSDVVTVSDDSDDSSSSSDDDSLSSSSSSSSSLLSLDNSDASESWSNEEPNVDENDMEWEADMSLALPHFEPPTSSPLRSFLDRFLSPRLARSRERSWSLEECSICFDVILQNQQVMSLPCTHHFHQACILPWLQEQQTCPNCRKPVD